MRNAFPQKKWSNYCRWYPRGSSISSRDTELTSPLHPSRPGLALCPGLEGHGRPLGSAALDVPGCSGAFRQTRALGSSICCNLNTSPFRIQIAMQEISPRTARVSPGSSTGNSYRQRQPSLNAQGAFNAHASVRASTNSSDKLPLYL